MDRDIDNPMANPPEYGPGFQDWLDFGRDDYDGEDNWEGSE